MITISEFNPTTKAGQFLKEEDGKLIKERLTSYGSIALINLVNNFVIVYYYESVRKHYFITCGNNTTLINKLWECC